MRISFFLLSICCCLCSCATTKDYGGLSQLDYRQLTVRIPNVRVNLYPHQLVPINYLDQNPNQKGLLVAHYLGTGKTYLSLAFAERFSGRKVVIIAPRFVKAHWLQEMKSFGTTNRSRFTILDYEEAAQKLTDANLSETILVIDEAHNLVKHLRSSDQEESLKYVQLYTNLRKANRILALTGTPFFESPADVAYLVNLVSGKDLLPFDEQEFRAEYTRVRSFRSAMRGFLTESMFLQMPALPLVFGFGAMALFASYVAVVPGLAVGIALLPAINMATPLSNFPLKELDADKLNQIFAEYVSFYDLTGDLRDQFPRKVIHTENVEYSQKQVEFFFKFAQQSLSTDELGLLLSDYDLEKEKKHAAIATSSIQRQIAQIPFSGREIGNLFDAPKFDKILEQIQSKPGKVVIYSNYYQNGVVAFGEFLKTNGIDNFKILEPNLSIDAQAQIVSDYNQNKTRILLLHPEIVEGISLQETRQLHILEPIYSSSIAEQVMGRAVRLNSHIALPPDERQVDIFIWKSVLAPFNYHAFHERLENWAKYTPELNPWSQWGIGMTQVDPQAKAKMQSPDDYAFSHYKSLEHSFGILRQTLQISSIESRVQKEV